MWWKPPSLYPKGHLENRYWCLIFWTGLESCWPRVRPNGDSVGQLQSLSGGNVQVWNHKGACKELQKNNQGCAGLSHSAEARLQIDSIIRQKQWGAAGQTSAPTKKKHLYDPADMIAIIFDKNQILNSTARTTGNQAWRNYAVCNFCTGERAKIPPWCCEKAIDNHRCGAQLRCQFFSITGQLCFHLGALLNVLKCQYWYFVLFVHSSFQMLLLVFESPLLSWLPYLVLPGTEPRLITNLYGIPSHGG